MRFLPNIAIILMKLHFLFPVSEAKEEIIIIIMAIPIATVSTYRKKQQQHPIKSDDGDNHDQSRISVAKSTLNFYLGNN